MGLPITTKDTGICFAFPDVCLTPAPPSAPIPIPYPNIGQLSDATGEAASVLVNDKAVITSNSKIPTTTGDEAGSAHNTTKGEVKFVTFSATVFAEGGNVVRLSDTTTQNKANAVGQVLGGNPIVLVG